MKRYPLNQSRLYKISSPQDLARRLNMGWQELEELANRSGNYIHFPMGKKKRKIQNPKPRLKALHRKITRWISCIETPNHLHSAVRGRSYITNAKAHSFGENLIKLDIRSFFQSVKKHSVYVFFVDTMKCREDAAMLLAKLLTVDGHLPTGSPVSPILSYFAHKPMFDEIAQLADDLDLRFTVYVDDMCLSGDRAVRETSFLVQGIIARHKLQSHKRRYYPARVARIVTGVALTQSGIRLPHRRNLKIKEAFDDLRRMPNGTKREKAFHALRSRLYEAGQLESKWIDRAKSLKASEMKSHSG